MAKAMQMELSYPKSPDVSRVDEIRISNAGCELSVRPSLTGFVFESSCELHYVEAGVGKRLYVENEKA